jgi:hypothetical protein
MRLDEARDQIHVDTVPEAPHVADAGCSSCRRGGEISRPVEERKVYAVGHQVGIVVLR